VSATFLTATANETPMKKDSNTLHDEEYNALKLDDTEACVGGSSNLLPGELTSLSTYSMAKLNDLHTLIKNGMPSVEQSLQLLEALFKSLETSSGNNVLVQKLLAILETLFTKIDSIESALLYATSRLFVGQHRSVTASDVFTMWNRFRAICLAISQTFRLEDLAFEDFNLSPAWLTLLDAMASLWDSIALFPAKKKKNLVDCGKVFEKMLGVDARRSTLILETILKSKDIRFRSYKFSFVIGSCFNTLEKLDKKLIVPLVDPTLEYVMEEMRNGTISATYFVPLVDFFSYINPDQFTTKVFINWSLEQEDLPIINHIIAGLSFDMGPYVPSITTSIISHFENDYLKVRNDALGLFRKLLGKCNQITAKGVTLLLIKHFNSSSRSSRPIFYQAFEALPGSTETSQQLEQILSQSMLTEKGDNLAHVFSAYIKHATASSWSVTESVMVACLAYLRYIYLIVRLPGLGIAPISILSSYYSGTLHNSTHADSFTRLLVEALVSDDEQLRDNSRTMLLPKLAKISTSILEEILKFAYGSSEDLTDEKLELTICIFQQAKLQDCIQG
jgi:hypothetical protein